MAPKFTYQAYDLVAEHTVANMHLVELFTKPPAWTRLEPQSHSGNPDAGVQARVHDPLWLMGRQWQFGEFEGEDCGTPVSVDVSAVANPVTGFRAGDAGSGAAPVAVGGDWVIEPEIEREPWVLPNLRDRAEAGAVLLASLMAGGFSAAAALRTECAFDLGAAELVAQRPDAAWLMIARETPDAERAADQMEAAALPGWLGNEPADVQAEARNWLTWYRRNVSPKHALSDSWLRERLEYQFALQIGGDRSAQILRAPLHDGGTIDWHTFDLGGRQQFLDLQGAAEPVTVKAKVHATRLQYAGMPADRLWEFEDGQVNLGITEVQPNDLARLCLLEFAMVFGNDWLIAPIDLPRGVLASVTEVSYVTTFGERIRVAPADDQGRKGHFRLFSTSGDDGGAPAFLIPPGGRTAMEGPVCEEVIFARDETANLTWAIELKVEGADGLARDRSREEVRPLPPQPVVAGADLAYQLETGVPEYWIPFVPVPVGRFGGFVLRKGSFGDTDTSLGRILEPTPFNLKDEEVPREGVRVRRVPSLIRDDGGTMVRWTARRVGPASGESASHLAYDNTFRRD